MEIKETAKHRRFLMLDKKHYAQEKCSPLPGNSNEARS
tara:strand:+ start:524 stop:637 length:114 start_codon:yes stop_codon:yes gene_type:complete